MEILGKQSSDIVKLAVENQSSMTDGVVQYNYVTGKVYGGAFTTGTIENPENPVIEIFRLSQGEWGNIDMRCWENCDCPFSKNNDGVFDDDVFIEDYGTRQQCCIDAYTFDEFDDDYCNNFKEEVESDIRDILIEHLGATLSKLDEIRIAVSDILTPWEYINVRQDNWEMDVMDTLVENAFDCGFVLEELDKPLEYLDACFVNLCYTMEYSDNETVNKALVYFAEGKLDETLSILYGRSVDDD